MNLNWMDWIVVIDSMFIITLVALQSAKGDLSEAITGANSELFKNQKERGAELFLSRSTLVTTVILVVLVVIRNAVFK